jgi:flagellar motility protein MotE (MotC chaperone)
MKNPSSVVLFFFLFMTAILFSYHLCPAEEALPAATKPPSSFSSVEERRLLTKMQEAQANATEEQKGLPMREKELKTLTEEVDKKLGEINQKLEELQAMQKNIKVLLTQKDAEELKRTKELAKIYEKMAPDKAAFALANMDERLATNLLANMKAKSAAKILNILDRKKTSELSTTFSTVK